MRGLLCGGIGFALGLLALLHFDTRPTGRSERRDKDPLAGVRRTLGDSVADQDRIRELELRLEQELLVREKVLREKEAELRERDAEIERLHAEAPAAEIPAFVLRAGEALGVPEDALRAAFDAHHKPTRENLDRLAGHGIDGFRALVALLHAGLSGRDLDLLFKRCWTPAVAGQEQLLIETAESARVHYSRWTALRVLGVTDTPLAREYVVGRLRVETDPGLFMSAAEAAGELKESRALPDLLRGMRNKEWNADRRWRIFAAAALVAGDGARNVMIDYLREPDADMLETALGWLDAEAAHREAAALLAGPRAASLTGEQLRAVRQFADKR